MSLPMRERGLKHCAGKDYGHGDASLPMRERGLKLDQVCQTVMDARRSPCGSVD